MKTNIKTTASHVYADERLAGGFGPHAAKQLAEQQLRRLVLSCLLWEDIAYADGTSVAQHIKDTIPQVDPAAVAAIAVEARFQQKLRHVPLLICREMARLESHKHLVATTLQKVIHRPDELAEFLSLYWKDNGKKTLSAQVKRGLAAAFNKFNGYQLAKWNKPAATVKLRDVLFLTHAHPDSPERESLLKQLADKTLPTPDTWEVGLSAATSEEEKRTVWERLIHEKKLGAFALLKNLRNMEQVGVPHETVSTAIRTARPSMLLPIDFLKAAAHAPRYMRDLETLMSACAYCYPRLPGHTVFVVDVSGSMQHPLSSKSEFTRLDAGAAMAVLAGEMCERVTIYATAGSDTARTHKTQQIPPYRGFALADAVKTHLTTMGGGGIFTRQCLAYIRTQERTDPDRIIVFSDSQDCDFDDRRRPKPFGKYNYIVDVSSHKHGVNYDGIWTSEITGWSASFLSYIAACEGQSASMQEEE